MGGPVHRLQAARGTRVSGSVGSTGARSSCATRGAWATRRTRRPTATRAPTRSGTRRGPSAGFARRTSRRSVSGTSRRSTGVGPRAERRHRARPATERSAGKDTTTGHWEMMGIVLDRALPAVPRRVPAEVIEPFERAIGREVLGNVPASGTEIIAELGEEHLRTGPADRVHERRLRLPDRDCHVRRVPLPTLYEWCRVARRHPARPARGGPRDRAAVRRRRRARSSARPERRDFSVPPPGPTVLDRAPRGRGSPSTASARSGTSSSDQGITEGRYSDSNDHGVDLTLEYLRRPGPAFVFTNLVDFDSKYGHRNDPRGLRGGDRGIRRAAPGARAARWAAGSAVPHRRPRLRPDDAVDRSHAERTPLLAAGSRRAARDRDPRAVRGPRRRSRTCSASRSRPLGQLRDRIGSGVIMLERRSTAHLEVQDQAFSLDDSPFRST